MIIPWMMYSMIVGGLVTVAARAAESSLRDGKRQVRWVWASAILLTFSLSVLAPFRISPPSRGIALPANVTATPRTGAITHSRLADMAQAAASFAKNVRYLLEVPVKRASATIHASSAPVELIATGLWVFASSTCLFMLVLVYVRYATRRISWPVVQLFGVTVRVAPDTGPAVMGIAPPEIVIPKWVLSRDDGEQLLVLSHEQEHVRARDPFLLLSGCVAVALMPWNAALWFMWSRLRLAVELDCDARVLQRGAHKPAYGKLLVDLSEQRAMLSSIMPAFSFGTSHLEQRLLAMTTPPLPRSRVTTRAASGAVTLIALAAACQSELPTAVQVEKMDVAALESRLPVAEATTYTVDGKSVSKTEATAMASGDIESINVVKAVKGHSLAQVRIKTRNAAANLHSDSMQIVADTLILRDGSRTMNFLADSGQNVRLMLRGQPVDNSYSVKANGKVQLTGTASAVNPVKADGARGTPLLIIDGKISEGGLEQIKAERIESVEIIKGRAAIAAYADPRAVNGVIVIKTKQ